MSRPYVSDELIHWTGRAKEVSEAYQILYSICSELKLRLTFCPNYVDDTKEFAQNTVMACFTDIPLRFSREHCSKFGEFGIAFRKPKMIGYGANPVHYTTGKHFERIKHVAKLLEHMVEMEKDREWKDTPEEPYQFSEDETVALKEVTEFLQEYSYKANDDAEYVTYYQREWRLAFNSLTFASSGKEPEPGMASFQGGGVRFMKFARDDVAYLVVPLKYYCKAWKLARQLGCGLKIYELVVDRC